MKKALMITLALMCSTAHAEQYIEMHMTSRHTSDKEHNEANPGVGYMQDSYTVGVYRNSHHKTSFYAGKYLQTDTKYVNIGVIAAVVTGYKEQVNRSVQPILLPYTTVGGERLKLKIGYIPTDKPVFTFSLQVRM